MTRKQLLDRLAAGTVEELHEALAFFDSDRLRGHYTGLIGDLRRELERRGSPRNPPPQHPRLPGSLTEVAERCDCVERP